MFQAKVYKICIASAGVPMREERLALDVVSQWNTLHGEEHGVVFLPVSQDVTPDIYLFVIDNYIDVNKVDSAIATGAKVVLFFSAYHDPKNTIDRDLAVIEDYRNGVDKKCACIDYRSISDFENQVIAFFENYYDNTIHIPCSF